MIRFGHEMNGNWYVVDGQPAAYVAAWRHVVSVFRGEARPTSSGSGRPTSTTVDYPFARYFPGDEWVDYVGPRRLQLGTLRRRREPVAEPLRGVLLLLQDAHPAQRQAGDLRRDLLQRDRRRQGGVDPAGLPEDDPAAVPPRPGGALVQSGHGAGLASQFFLVRATGISRRGVELPLRWARSGAQQPRAKRQGPRRSRCTPPASPPARAERPRPRFPRAKVAYRLSHSARLKVSVRDSRGRALRPVTIPQPTKGGRVALSKLVGGRPHAPRRLSRLGPGRQPERLPLRTAPGPLPDRVAAASRLRSLS